LAQIYTFLLTELVSANIKADADRVASCRRLVEPLRDAWREAALSVAAAPAASPR
jgi:flagellar protein FliS